MAKAATKKGTSKAGKDAQEKIPGTDKPPAKKGDPVKLRAQQMAADSKELLKLLKEKAKIEEKQADLRKKKKVVQGRIDEISYNLAFSIQDPQFRLDEVATQAAEEALKQGKGTEEKK